VGAFAEPFVTVSKTNRISRQFVIVLSARNALEVRLALQRTLMHRRFRLEVLGLKPTNIARMKVTAR
jgi:hypothetical protein